MTQLIQLDGIAKSYFVGDEKVTALKTIDLQIKEGDFIALSGPSGSGKSTLLNILGLLDKPDQGRYLLQKQDITALSPKQKTLLRREKIGFIFQSFNLIPVMSAYENVEYPLLLSKISAKERKLRTQKILQQVGLESFMHHLPDRLSGGQRQRVAIARALVKNPLLVIADEPTANLDTQTANQIIDLMHLFATQCGTTFIVATHDDRMTQRCERQIRLLDGRIVATVKETRYEVA
ncbi:MAG TPA: ABC transporter ATP-binding protein [Pseudomonadales bacterium]|nr:ABC transporter ATP-binding protein [Pseudomonadales bacterium]